MDTLLSCISKTRYASYKKLLNLYVNSSSVAKHFYENWSDVLFFLDTVEDDYSRQVFLREIIYRANSQLQDQDFGALLYGMPLIQQETYMIENYIKNKKIKIPYFDTLKREEERHPVINGIGAIFFHKKYNYYTTLEHDSYIGVQNGDVCIDIGCYVGDSSLFFKQENKAKKVYCIDLQQSILNECKKTMIVNNYKEGIDFDTICAHLYDKELDETYIIEDPWAAEIVKDPKKYADKYGWDKLKKGGKTITLDTVIENNNIKPDSIKVSAMHEEVEVILGSTETIKKYLPTCIVGIYELEHSIAIMKIFKKINSNYKFYVKRLGRYSEMFLFATVE